ncbi:MAG TPA: EamA family transporter [Candidatus Baltobacteraceae bacterium]|nr:EamA family transporter [Candidatus Baltobacteraceae bacterium]
MTPARGLRLKTAILIVIMVSVAPLGDMFLGKGMKQIGPLPGWAPSQLFHFFFDAFTSSTVWTGIGLLIAFFVAYLLVLSWADYSYVLPASSISTLVVALLAYFVLHETIKPLRWAGVALICLGVFVVGHTQPRTTER